MQCCLGKTVENRAGIGIFDTLFVANGSLAVHGDIHLVDAHVLGQGSLVMRAESSAKIVSQRSEVNNLVVVMPGRVQLEGELVIRQSLSLQSGILDVSAGALILSDSAALQLKHGASILQNSRFASLPVKGGHQGTFEFSAKAILTPLTTEHKRYTPKTYQHYHEVHDFPLMIYREAATAPPEHSRMITV
ncbi:hypothetical protein DSL64_13745 [Dyadobacter luteus]|uniref:Uncharacterized protein n=2 Tax=Dyadobacter luteus TaxID=2259619 RepID=A0A3D8YAX5_9BACT|nr:hypothetical protein DSL64_13745 [Dyadobacter luteus]